MRFWGFLLAVLVPLQAWAEAPETSPRPLARGGEAVAQTAPVALPAPPTERTLRPLPRPQEVSTLPLLPKRVRPAPRPASAQPPAPVRVVYRADAPRAAARPANMATLVKKAARQPETVIFSSKGAICGSSSIKGTAVKPIGGRLRGCGIAKPVRITSVQGVRLSTPSTMDCNTAKALDTWVRKGVKPAVGRRGGGVKQLKVAAHYACRTRNNKKGAKISEHGKGRAIDISAIVLKDGTAVTVLRHWRSKSWGKALKQMHRAACGPFGTVLGPNADRYHQDHFHFDTARYRSGSYCR